jgi:hypothetical protein
MTVFSSPLMLSFHFTLHNQILALAVPAVLLWHASCEVPALKSMSTSCMLLKLR